MKINLSNKSFFYVIFCFSIVLIGYLFFQNPIHQDLGYHNFAEQRLLGHIPHWGDVLTNLSFAIAGIMLLKFKNNLEYYSGQKLLFKFYIFSCFALCVGSGFYHWNPNNFGLLLDRATMLMGFSLILLDTSIRYGVFKHRNLCSKIAGIQFLFLITLIPWVKYDRLELYVLAQFFVMSVMPLLALKNYFEQGNQYKHILFMFVFYSLAKFFEHYDQFFFDLIHFSGHSIKHICYAIALYLFGKGILKKS